MAEFKEIWIFRVGRYFFKNCEAADDRMAVKLLKGAVAYRGQKNYGRNALVRAFT